MEPYQYRPLNAAKHEIRLLRLRECTGPLTCTIEHVSLDDRPFYYALSYAWGDASITKNLFSDEGTFQITENLAYALEHLRQRTRYNHLLRELIFWIDALCINQSDDEEKTMQVQQMKTVFEQSNTVVVWLGAAGEATDFAMQTFEWLGSECLKYLDPSREHQPGDDQLEDLITSVPVDGAARSDYSMDGTVYLYPIKEITDRPWWTRLWTLQELVVAPLAIFACGFSVVEWTKIKAVLMFTEDYKVYRSTRGTDPTKAYSEEDYRVYESICSQTRCHYDFAPSFPSDTSRLFPLGALLLETAVRTSCTDPRDRIYALLGIAVDAESLGIYPDYSKPTPDVFKQAIKALLRKFGLDILITSNTISYDVEDLPWWMTRSSLTSGPYQTSTLLHDPFSEQRRYRAGISNLHINEITADMENEIYLRGVVVDVVEEIASTFYVETNETPETLLTWLAEMHDMVGEDTIYKDPPDLEQALCWTPLMDKRDFWNEYGGETEALRQYRILAGITEPPEEELGDPEQWRMTESTLYRLYARWSCNRSRPFRTSKGFLGLGPPGMEVGDVVCILFGASVPFVLRPLPQSNGDDGYEDGSGGGVFEGEILGGDASEGEGSRSDDVTGDDDRSEKDDESGDERPKGCSLYGFIGASYVHSIMYGEYLEYNPGSELFGLV